MRLILSIALALFISISCSRSTKCCAMWMIKNLDVSKYRNGDNIPQVTDSTQWKSLTTGAWCYYDNDPANGEIYGKLYNWYAVNDPRGLAPKGYHIPSDAEWRLLLNCLGEDSIVGGKMKEVGLIHWQSPNIGANNSCGFAGLPGGDRNFNGTFFAIGICGGWWSSTEDDAGGMIGEKATQAWEYSLLYSDSVVYREHAYKSFGLSVRCLSD